VVDLVCRPEQQWQLEGRDPPSGGYDKPQPQSKMVVAIDQWWLEDIVPPDDGVQKQPRNGSGGQKQPLDSG
jgi:hypothetical protein